MGNIPAGAGQWHRARARDARAPGGNRTAVFQPGFDSDFLVRVVRKDGGRYHLGVPPPALERRENYLHAGRRRKHTAPSSETGSNESSIVVVVSAPPSSM